ncbi:galactosylgalactosylxylosylprotein 3-beta-glucuronosyltransferase 2-like [Engraulis encrasicolus]|uniref:galactosylgalactosylxylosylprotein 3-beta-glucuronosyltransferase 2-like n=1 Tax=Engraulis encrasicolus TaxID=184585 RepID=UPI002FCF5844
MRYTGRQPFSSPGPVIMTLGRLLHYGIYLAWTLLAGLLVHLSTWEMPPDLPFVYVITPTYRRPTQKADLTRLANTLGQVPNLHWIVVEDSDKRSPMVAGVLSRCRAPSTHMNVPMPSYCKPHCVARGTEQRNMGLDWLRKNRGPVDSGVVYFGDDDNAYDLEVFEEIRSTKRVSVFPVGLIAGRWYERPKVRDGRVVGWYTGYGGRKFCIDMAGFAVNLHVLLAKPNARFVMKGVGGVQETDFLSLLTKVEDLEPLANNCTRVLVWHTRTQPAYVGKHVKDETSIEA